MLRTSIAFMLLGIQLSTAGQNVSLGSIGEAIELALEKNIDFQNYLLNQEKADLAYKQAKSYQMPTISGSFSGQYNIDLAATPLPDFSSEDPEATVIRQIGLEYNYNAGIVIYQDLFNRGNKLNSSVAKLSLEMDRVSSNMYRDLLKEQVSVYYYTALISERAIEIGREDVKSAESIYHLTSDKFDQGLVDLITLNSSKINLNTVRQNLNANKQLEIQSITELKKLFGMLPVDSLSLTNTVDYLLPEVYTSEQLSDNLLAKNAELQLRQADAFLKVSQSALLPTLSFNSYFGRQQFRDDFGLSLNNDNWTNYSYLSLNLSVPIFSGFNTSRNIAKSKIDHTMAVNERLKAEQQTSLDDQRLIADYNISLQDAKYKFETYKLYDENQTLTFQKYKEGLISLDSYLMVFQDYIKAENAYLNSMSKVYTYYSQILPRI